VTNTNRYAELKRFPSMEAVKAFPSQEAEGLGREGSSSSARTITEERPWYPIGLGELKVFIGPQIIIGVYRYPAMEDYWAENEGVKYHEFEKMCCNRY